jgi:hypothetical protein
LRMADVRFKSEIRQNLKPIRAQGRQKRRK